LWKALLAYSFEHITPFWYFIKKVRQFNAMEGWKDGRMEGWKDGRVDEC
jgi:hypothetical protein